MELPTAETTVKGVRPNVRAALDYLDQILSRGGEDAMELWDVLTALRGPDDCDDRKKEETTIPIRQVAFPLTRDAISVYRPDEPGVHHRAGFGVGIRIYPYAGDSNYWGAHFAKHGYRAAVALGLI